LVFCWQALQVYFAFGGNWTALFHHDVYPPMPAGFEGTYLHPHGGDYDGQYYRYLTRDPWPPYDYAKWMDSPAQRGSRVLVPALAWALSLGGRIAPDAAYILLTGLFTGLGVYFCARWMDSRGRSAWWGLAFLVLPGVISSVDRLLIDVALAALVAGFLYAAESGHQRLLLACAVAAPLVRETGFALPAALLLSGRVQAGLATFFPGALWTIFVLLQYPLQGRSREIGFLPLEWVRRLVEPRTHAEPAMQLLLRSLDTVGLLALAFLLIWTVRSAWPSIRDPQAAAALVFLGGGLALGGLNVMSDPYHWGRVQSPWMLWALLGAVASRQWPAPIAIAAISLTPIAYGARNLLR
jgi:hypothetical protein